MDKETLLGKLEGLIDENGPRFPIDEPYEVFRRLLACGDVDRFTAAKVLHLLAVGLIDMLPQPKVELEKEIRNRCSFDDEASAELADLFSSLYSLENLRRWNRKKEEGFRRFLETNLTIECEATSCWDPNEHYSCISRLEAKVVLKATQKAAKDKLIARELEKNPFMDADRIGKIFKASLYKHISDSFEEYCNADDYYPPVPEDFELEDYVVQWASSHGFEVVCIEGRGWSEN